MRTLRPIQPKASYIKPVEKSIAYYFRDTLFTPLINILKENKIVLNSKDAIAEAIENGDIYYSGSVFYGKFNATLTRNLKELGANYDSRVKGWRISQDKLSPVHVAALVAQGQRFDRAQAAMIQSLPDGDKIKPVNVYDYSKLYDDVVIRVDKSIGVKPKIDQSRRDRISKEWSDNLDLHIKGFTDEEVLKLRRRLENEIVSGKRPEQLADIVLHEFDVSVNKAKFLARQETSLFTHTLKRARYSDVGINEYEWSTSQDERVRRHHKELNGKRYYYSTPPVVNEKGERKHPGMDWGCRCVDIPILN